MRCNAGAVFPGRSPHAFLFLAVLLLATMTPLMAAPPPPSVPAQPVIKDLGNQRYRIGAILVDKAQQTFRVEGRLLRLEPPLEFLAVRKGGMKAYESLLELDSDAIEFNLACILIGLDEKKGKAPSFHFSPEPVEGTPVAIWVSWEADGKTVRMPAAKLLLQGDKLIDSDAWVYTGSIFAADGTYLAQQDGTLVGFVHNPASIIEHREGIALGNYGDVLPRVSVLPAVGTPVTLEVRRLKTSPGQ